MDVAALRCAADLALGPHGDLRARAALTSARITVTRDVRAWEGSEGEVHAHRVLLGLDAATLGALRASPAAHDALVEALAAGLAETRGHTLESLELEWAVAFGPASAYRGTAKGDVHRDDVDELRRAAIAYLDAGPDEVENALSVEAMRTATLRLSTQPSGVRWLAITVSARAPAASRRLCACVEDLLGPGSRAFLYEHASGDD